MTRLRFRQKRFAISVISPTVASILILASTWASTWASTSLALPDVGTCSAESANSPANCSTPARDAKPRSSRTTRFCIGEKHSRCFILEEGRSSTDKALLSEAMQGAIQRKRDCSPQETSILLQKTTEAQGIIHAAQKKSGQENETCFDSASIEIIAEGSSASMERVCVSALAKKDRERLRQAIKSFEAAAAKK